MTEKGKTAISGQVDAEIYKEFIRETSYFGLSKWVAIETAMRLLTNKLRNQNKPK